MFREKRSTSRHEWRESGRQISRGNVRGLFRENFKQTYGSLLFLWNWVLCCCLNGEFVFTADFSEYKWPLLRAQSVFTTLASGFYLPHTHRQLTSSYSWEQWAELIRRKEFGFIWLRCQGLFRVWVNSHPLCGGISEIEEALAVSALHWTVQDAIC